MTRALISKENQLSPCLPPLWQSLTYPGDALWAWAVGAALWIPWLGGAQSWSCGISCKEIKAQKDPGVPSLLFREDVIAKDGAEGRVWEAF